MSDSPKKWLIKVIAGPHQGAEISLGEGKALVGSDDDCDVVLHDVLIAPQHFELEFGGAGTGVSAAPLGGRVFVNGKRIKEGRQNVPNFAFISAGGTHLVVGPEKGPWPLLSAADVPELEKAQDEEKEKSDDASEASDNLPENADHEQTTDSEKAGNVPPTAKRRTAWVGVLLGCLLLAGWYIAWQNMMPGLNPDAAAAPTAVEKASLALAKAGVRQQVRIEEMGDKILATGYVDTDMKQREVLALLRETVPGVLTRVWSLEKVASTARSLLNAQKLSLQVNGLRDGELRISGMVGSTEEWERVKQMLLTEVPGLSGIDDQVRIDPRAVADASNSNTRSPIKRLSSQQVVATTDTSEDPSLDKADAEVLSQAMSVDGDATIASITVSKDGLSWMKTSLGNVYFKGGRLPDGSTIVSIAADHINVDQGGKKREVRRGQRLDGQDQLQTSTPSSEPQPKPKDNPTATSAAKAKVAAPSASDKKMADSSKVP